MTNQVSTVSILIDPPTLPSLQTIHFLVECGRIECVRILLSLRLDCLLGRNPTQDELDDELKGVLLDSQA